MTVTEKGLARLDDWLARVGATEVELPPGDDLAVFTANGRLFAVHKHRGGWALYVPVASLPHGKEDGLEFVEHVLRLKTRKIKPTAARA